ncbi:hypothetical protein T261_5217 [Streptomyces lydicus]|nr:hypothetical protein T261_5217 [Streptomyces lydicus]
MSTDDLKPEMAQHFAHVRRGGHGLLENLPGPPDPLALEVRRVHPQFLHPLMHVPPLRTPRIHP